MEILGTLLTELTNSDLISARLQSFPLTFQFFAALFAILDLVFFYIADFLFRLFILFNELCDGLEYDPKLYSLGSGHRNILENR